MGPQPSGAGAGIAAALMLLVLGSLTAGGAWVMGRSIHDGLRAHDWVSVPAELRSFNDGQVSYAYVWGQDSHTGSRIGTVLLRGYSVLDDWDDRMDQALFAALETRTRVITALVNPLNPSESMLNREIRWPLLLGEWAPLLLILGASTFVAARAVGRNALGIGDETDFGGPAKDSAGFAWLVTIVLNLFTIMTFYFRVPAWWTGQEWAPLYMLGTVQAFALMFAWVAIRLTAKARRA